MQKVLIITLALMMLIGILSAQKPVVNPNATPGPRTDSNPNLKDRPAPEMPMMGMMEKLNLSEAQKTRMETLRAEHMKMMNTSKAEIENIKIDLEAAIKTENYKKAKDLNKQLFAKKLMMADARIDHIAAMIKDLNPEQKAMIKEFLPMMGQCMDKKDKKPCDCKEMGQDKKHKQNKDCSGSGNCDEKKDEPKPMTPPKTDKQLKHCN
ncbi:MAG: Spy/CpxP family protein refolding chaperone [Candidatus Cloacimonadaceae bacterium]|nr:Spy/CpxP family protein refolding chaperone [Candidatus Cloacimonadaceae bacterium]MDP3113956.1 Spy/CpxP family protein refolding chaperone [Candidatus Cloacimonadaceae bacterium]